MAVLASDTQVYEAHSKRRPLIPYLRESWRRREFAVEMSRARLKAQHGETVLGRLWLIGNPLLLATVYLFLIDVLRKGHHPPGIFAHLLACIFAYSFFQESAREGVRSIVNGNQLILNSSFPTILLPLSCVVTAFRRFWPTIFIYVPAHAISGRPFGWETLEVIPLLFLLIVLAAGVSILMASLQVFFRDIREFLPYVLRIMMFMAPVLYLPAEATARFSRILDITPVGQLLTGWTDVLYYGDTPGINTWLIAAAWAFGFLGLGLWVCTSRERDFAIRL